MKKIVALLLATTMAICCLVGCGGAAAATDTTTESTEITGTTGTGTDEAEATSDAKPFEGKTLTATFYVLKDEASDTAFWNEIKDGFKAETGADLDFLLVDPGNITAQEIANLSAGAGTDILQVNGGNENQFYKNGFLEKLDDYFTDEQKADWMQWENHIIDGNHYLVPYVGGCSYRLIYVNKDIANEIGVELPAYDSFTWDTLIDLGTKAKAAGYTGFVTPMSDDADAPMNNYCSYLHQACGSIVDADGNYTLNSPESIKALQFINNIFNEAKIADTVTYNTNSAAEEFCQGKTLLLGSMWSKHTALDDAGINYEAYHMKGDQYATCNASDSLAINAASENKDLAAAFISYFMQKDVWSKHNADLYNNASLILASADKSLLFPAGYEHLATDCNNFWTFPGADEIGSAVEYMITHEQLVAMGDETPEEAAEAMQSSIDALLDK